MHNPEQQQTLTVEKSDTRVVRMSKMTSFLQTKKQQL